VSASVQHATIEQPARHLYLTTVADQFAPLAEEAVRKKQSTSAIWRRCLKPSWKSVIAAQ
jgi:hypothetical protein